MLMLKNPSLNLIQKIKIFDNNILYMKNNSFGNPFVGVMAQQYENLLG